MMNIRKNIPNTITCLNLVSGCIACVMALKGDLGMAALWVIIASVFDFCDGFAARALKAYSPLGKELDSLSDIVSFGVAPGMIVYTLLSEACLAAGWTGAAAEYLPYMAFVIPALSGLRLAKFNLDECQSTSFIGMPVPAHALFWISAGYSVQPFIPTYSTILIPAIIILSIASSLLLVSKIPMFSLKVKTLAWKGNELRYILIASATLFVVLFGMPGIAGAILLYLLLSLFSGRQ